MKLLLVCGLLFSSVALGITADELRALSADKDSEEAKRAQRVEAGNLAPLVTQEDKKQRSVYSTPKPAASSKYSQAVQQQLDAGARTSNTVSAPSYQKSNNGETPAVPESGNYYISPGADRNTGGKIVSDAVTIKLSWGIRLGTWIAARLDRNTSSAEPGSVELITSEDVIGDKRTLPSGTTLFAAKTLNSATKRMELTVKRGITPDGKEFSMRGLVFDPSRVSGLSGIYQVDEKGIVEHGLSKGLRSGISTAVRSTAGSTPLGAAASGAADSVMQDSERGVEYNTAPAATIYVAPQPLLIRVEEKF